MRRLVSGLQTFLTIYPYLILAPLYVMAWRGTALLGHWPQPMVNDPGYVSQSDVLMGSLYRWLDTVAFLWQTPPPCELFFFFGVISPPFRLPGTALRTHLLRLTLGLIGWFVLVWDPLHALEWYID